MSCSDDRRAGGECRFVQIAAHGTKCGGLVVAHENEIRVEASGGEVVSHLGLIDASDRRERQGKPNASIVDGCAEPRRPGPGGQCLDGFDQLPRRHGFARSEPQQVVGLALDGAGAGQAG